MSWIRSRRRLAATVVFGLGIVPLSASEPLLSPLSQERTLSASAGVSSPFGSDGDSDEDAALDFGRFVSNAGAQASVPGAFADAGALQDSVIGPNAILASGTADFGVSAPNGGGGASSRSQMSVTFWLNAPADYSLQGTFSFGQGGSFSLEGAQATIHAGSASASSVVDESGSLPIGPYTFTVVAEEGGSGSNITFGERTDYDFSLVFSGYGSAGKVPDGRDLIGEPLRIAKTETVSLLMTWGPSCLAEANDYAVYQAPLADPSAMVPAVCSTSGQLSRLIVPFTGSAVLVVVPTTGETEGSYGSTSNGTQRPVSDFACHPQFLCDPICP